MYLVNPVILMQSKIDTLKVYFLSNEQGIISGKKIHFVTMTLNQSNLIIGQSTKDKLLDKKPRTSY